MLYPGSLHIGYLDPPGRIETVDDTKIIQVFLRALVMGSYIVLNVLIYGPLSRLTTRRPPGRDLMA